MICTGTKKMTESTFYGATRRRIAGENITEEILKKYITDSDNQIESEVKKLKTKGQNSASSLGIASGKHYKQVCSPEFKPEGSQKQIVCASESNSLESTIQFVNRHSKIDRSRKVCIVHQNLQFVGNVPNKLELLAHNQNADVVAVSEHWRSLEELSCYKLDGFKLVSTLCREHGEHGGTAIYCKEVYVCTERLDLLL
ncbi:hypothetical protein HHI36_016188 [Cryptolaemus montrouzieri]|uniref:Uncharacterized protein n=1 Tax=Cryptolaemus montrouzieri TaxID=559131 RepID=A0ABD2NJV7_9CUCU